MAPLPRFFHAESLKAGDTTALSPEEAHHLAHVLRLEAGEECLLIDGKGTLRRARVAEVTKKRCRVEVLSVETAGAPSRVHLVFGLPKPAALEFILRRVTEVGISSFQPLITQHSLHPNEWNEGRWRKILVEAAKQCETPFFPELLAPVPFAQWLSARRKERPLLFCDEAQREGSPESTPTETEWEILVGAEGGWSEEETRAVLAHGAKRFGLGRNRLRAETAALVSVALIKRFVGEI